MINLSPQNHMNTGSGTSPSSVLPLLLLLLCAALLYVNPMLPVILILGIMVFLFAFRKPALYLALTFAAGILPQSVLGDSSSVFVAFSDVMAALMIVILVLYAVVGRIRPTLGALKVPLALFLSIVFFASVSHWRGQDAVLSLSRILEFTFCTTLIFASFIRTPAEAERCFVFLLVTEACLGLAAVVGFAAGARDGLYILGMNKNAIGPSLACGVVVGLVYLRSPDLPARFKPWIFTAFTLSLIGTILSLSRGAWMAAMAACLLVLALRRDIRGLAIMAAVAVPIFALCWSALPSDSAEYAGNISLGAHTMQIRLDHQAQAMELWKENPWLGAGIGLNKASDPENVYVLMLAEAGAIGLVGFVFLLGSFYALALRVHRIITQRDLWNTPIGRALLCCVGVFTVPTVHGAIDVYWRRGVVFLAWAAAGLCVSLFLWLSRQKSRSALPPKPAESAALHAA